jgi:hypothetical protein
MKHLLGLSICISMFFWSCGGNSKKSKLHFANSVESAYAWTDHPADNIIRSNEAHSGSYVCKVDAKNPYSVTFTMKLSDVSVDLLKSVHVSAWVNISDLQSNPQLVVELRDSTQKTIEWMPRQAAEFNLAPFEWGEMTADLSLEEKNRNNASNHLRVYVLNDKEQYCLVDDVELSFE